MKLEDMLKQQQKRGFMQKKIKAEMQSYDDYARDDLSPRPYNTPNVSDFKKNVKTNQLATDIRDTKTNQLATDIRDTKTNQLATDIRDTKTNQLAADIRDTKTNQLAADIRDTKTNQLAADIRDTKTNQLATDIRDTKTNQLAADIRDTKTNQLATDIRDTKTNQLATDIRDTKTNQLATDIRDTKNNKGLFFNIGRPTKGKNYRYCDLTGNAKKLVDEIAHQCMLVGDLTTLNIGKASFSKNTGVKLGAIKTTILRLREKSVIVSYEASKGRNSSWKFTLSAEVYQQYITSNRAG